MTREHERQSQHGQGQEQGQEVQEMMMEGSQQALEQTIDFQRTLARMAVSVLEWQETAQRQGVELTRSMLENYVRSAKRAVPEARETMRAPESMDVGMQRRREMGERQYRQEQPPETTTGQWITPQQGSQHPQEQPQSQYGQPQQERHPQDSRQPQQSQQSPRTERPQGEKRGGQRPQNRGEDSQQQEGVRIEPGEGGR